MGGTGSQGVVLPTPPLLQNRFVNVWRSHAPTLCILKSASDFCDKCTKLSRLVSSATNATIRESLLHVCSRQKKLVKNFASINPFKGISTFFSNQGNVHWTFEFAENILLPRLLREPGQLHFVTGLKIKIFGVHSSNLNNTFVYGLPEGHWAKKKSRNEVGSMLVHCIGTHKNVSTLSNGRTLCLHAYNGAGQNKHRYMLWMLAFRVVTG